MLTGEHGIVADVRMPPAEEQAAHDLLHLDFALGCPGESRSCHPSSKHDFLTCQVMQSAVQLGRSPGSHQVSLQRLVKDCVGTRQKSTSTSFSVLDKQDVADFASE